nr:hypothetical protein [uncultured Tolumonas sp.]
MTKASIDMSISFFSLLKKQQNKSKWINAQQVLTQLEDVMQWHINELEDDLYKIHF